MRSTMQDAPLTITDLFRHGAAVYPDSEVATFHPGGTRRATFAAVAERAERLAAGLRRLGVGEGDRVATFSWNHQEHLEAYLAIPCMGAVLHTLNIRLFAEQLVYIANHAEDKVVLVDDVLVPALAAVADQLNTVERYVIVGDGDVDPGALAGLGDTVRYEELLAAEQPGFAWPDLDERSAAAMCYTSGTTGNPKGVVYSHRSTWLHSLAVTSAATLGVQEQDRLLVIVPMFHANAWGMPYAGWMVGADFVFPKQHLQAEPIARLVADHRITVSAAVPTIWNDILHYAEDHPVDLSSLRVCTAGGSAVPRSLLEAFEQRHGVRIIQGWGMTETSPLAALAFRPKGAKPEEEFDYRAKTGRIIPGVELRVVDDAGQPQPWDGTSQGEIEVRGPWITGSYYGDPSPEKFHDGWLRTGDVGVVEPKGFLQITDRAKDVIKSGGEWISSVELENLLVGHPDVVEASVVGVPDERWQERPLACVVRRPGAGVEPADLRAYLAERVARWWVPERWAFIDSVPKTSVGKYDKKVLRALYAGDELDVVETTG